MTKVSLLDPADTFCNIEKLFTVVYIVNMLTKTDLQQITKIVQSETTKIVKFENQSLEKKINKRFDKLEGKLDYAINFLDRDYLKLLHRVETIEEHLGIEPTSP